jgi:hypothetical protein
MICYFASSGHQSYSRDPVINYHFRDVNETWLVSIPLLICGARNKNDHQANLVVSKTSRVYKGGCLFPSSYKMEHKRLSSLVRLPTVDVSEELTKADFQFVKDTGNKG